MKTEQPVSTHDRRLARVFYVGTGAFLVIGYALYFAARLLPPPTWALQMIEALKPALGALATAELVSDKPFPAQVVIIYCAFGSIVLTGWFISWMSLVKESWSLCRHKMMLSDLGRSRLKLVWSGVLFLALSLLFHWFLTNEPTQIDWRKVAFFSPRLGSVTFLLVAYIAASLSIPLALCALWSALTWPRASRNQFNQSTISSDSEPRR